MLASGSAQAQLSSQAIQRSIVQRDQQTAEFAAQLRGGPAARRELETLHAEQLRQALVPLSADPTLATDLQPYQRQGMAQERELRLPPPVVRVPQSPAAPQATGPLPLPGGLPHVVDAVAPEGLARE